MKYNKFIIGNKKAYDIMTKVTGFLLHYLSAQPNSQYNGLQTIPQNQRTNSENFELYANVPTNTYTIKGTQCNLYQQERFKIRCETFNCFGNYNVLLIRKDNLYDINEILSNCGFLICGTSYFTVDNSWLNDTKYYEDINITWGGRQVTTKTGKTWNIKPHSIDYRKYNLLKLYKDKKINLFAIDEYTGKCALNQQIVDLSDYDDLDFTNIKAVQYDKRKSYTQYYCKVIRPGDSRENVIIDHSYSLSFICNVLNKHGTHNYSDIKKLKRIIENKSRSLNPKPIKIQYDNGDIWELLISSKLNYSWTDPKIKRKKYIKEYMKEFRKK